MAERFTARWQLPQIGLTLSPAVRYGGAAALSVAFIAMRWLLAHFVIDDGYPFASLFIPVALSAFFGGLGPGLVALLITSGLSDFFLIPPLYTIGFRDTRTLLGTSWFALSGLVVSVLGEASRKAVLRSSSEADIRRAAQQLSMLSEERLQIAEQVLDGGVWERDLIDGSVFWTDGFRRLFDFDLQEASSREKWLNRIHVEDRQRVSGMMDDLIRRKLHRWVTEYRILTVNGRTRWIASHGRVLYDDANQPRRMLGIDLDVTARRLSEDDARDNETKIRLLMQYARVGDWEWNPQNGEFHCSRELYEILGFPAQVQSDFNGLMSCVHPADAPRVWSLLEQLQNCPGRDFDFENRFLSPDGSERFLHTRGSVIQGDDGVRLVGVTIDVSRTTKQLLAS
jgi:two-component system, sensor histidine kinase and response regulator